MEKQPQSETPISTESLLDSFGAIGHMPETNAEEAHSKHRSYNDAIITLEQRLEQIHNESMSASLDDGSQEEAADVQERDLIGQAMREFRSEMGRLHELIVRLES